MSTNLTYFFKFSNINERLWCKYRKTVRIVRPVLPIVQSMFKLLHAIVYQPNISYRFRERDLRIIRPFVYVREKAIRQFSTDQNLPVIMSPSTLEITKEKQRIRQLLAQQEIMYPKLFQCFRSALHPLLVCTVQGSKKKGKEEDNESVDYETEEEPVSN